jgi:putative nucleotide binding protein
MWKLSGRKIPHDMFAYVLSIDEYQRKVQLIGSRYFILMEFMLRPNAGVRQGSRVYVGKGLRQEVSKFVRYLSHEELSEQARMVLEDTVERAVREEEQFFVQFFNESLPITPKFHQLELLPGVGKKMVQKILEERAKEPFKSFEDIKNRTGLKDPARAIAERVMQELTVPQNVYIFVAHKKLFLEELME